MAKRMSPKGNAPRSEASSITEVVLGLAAPQVDVGGGVAEATPVRRRRGVIAEASDEGTGSPTHAAKPKRRRKKDPEVEVEAPAVPRTKSPSRRRKEPVSASRSTAVSPELEPRAGEACKVDVLEASLGDQPLPRLGSSWRERGRAPHGWGSWGRR